MRTHLHIHIGHTHQSKLLKEGLCVNMLIHCSPRISLHKNNKQMCFCLCIWTPCASKVLCVFCTRDMNSCFIPSACAASDFPHSTGHPAVQLHCTCALQFVSKRFPKSQNIFSAIQCAHHMQKRWGWKIGLCSGASWPGPPLPWCGSGFKDKWLHVNQIWHAV